MKTLQESIIGRRGTLTTLTFGGLKSGQIVRMKNGRLFLYLDYKDADSIWEVSDQMKRSGGGYDFTFGGFFYKSESHIVEFMPSGLYTLNLKLKRSNYEWDVQYVSEQVFKIGLYTEHQLEEMSRKIKFRKIK